MNDLLPCPFCGQSPANRWHPLGAPKLTCETDGCGMESDISGDSAAAAKSWNRRAALSPAQWRKRAEAVQALRLAGELGNGFMWVPIMRATQGATP